MQQSKNLYDVLGVKKNASIDDIKKAYKLLAMKYYPDKNKNDPEAENKFKELTTAKDVLLDPNKKYVYDTQGENGLNRINQMQHQNEMMDRMNEMRMAEKHTLIINLSLPLNEFYKGIKLNKDIKRKTLCSMCSGVGFNNAKIVKCTKCNGNGKVITLAMIGPGIATQQQINCDLCIGRGHKIESGVIGEMTKCNNCSDGVIMEDYKLEVDVPAGIRGNAKVSEDQGNEYEIGKRSGIVINFEVEKNDYFEWDNNDLVLGVTINIADALCGFKKQYLHPNGKMITVCSEEGKVTKSDLQKTISSMGMPIFNPYVAERTQLFGDLVISINVVFPDVIALDKIPSLKKLLDYRENNVMLKENIIYDIHNILDKKNDNTIHQSEQTCKVQ
jgi:DnaJ-class molecular chaperone